MAGVVVSQERKKIQEVDNETREGGSRQEEVKVQDQKEGEGAQAAPAVPAATMEQVGVGKKMCFVLACHSMPPSPPDIHQRQQDLGERAPQQPHPSSSFSFSTSSPSFSFDFDPQSKDPHPSLYNTQTVGTVGEGKGQQERERGTPPKPYPHGSGVGPGVPHRGGSNWGKVPPGTFQLRMGNFCA